MAFHRVQYFSGALGKATAFQMIFPDPSVPRPYHCMFLLHGLSDDETIWMRRTSIERYVEGKPLVVVMPDGGRGFYVDADQGYQYLQALAYELPSLLSHSYHIDGQFATAGLSMGGYGALRLALERPDLFKAAVSHSGAVGMGRYFPTPGDGSKWEAEFIRVFGKVEKGGRNDLIQLASNLKGNPQDSTNRLPALRIDCGTEDFLLDHNRQLNRDLTALGIPHEYEEFPGDHNWEYWDQHVQEAIAFCLNNLS